MLAITTKFQDKSIQIPEYKELQRKVGALVDGWMSSDRIISDFCYANNAVSQSEMIDSAEGALDVDYLAALDFLKSIEQ